MNDQDANTRGPTIDVTAIRRGMRRSARRASALVWAARCALVAAGIVLWDVVAANWVDPLLIGRPAEVLEQWVAWALDGTLIEALLATGQVVVAGLAWGVLVGTIAGTAAGMNKHIARLIDPIITATFALPKIALVPLMILWFGLGTTQRTVFTAIVVFFFIFYAVLSGVRAVPVALDNMLRIAGARLRHRVYLLYVPASLGWILSGLRIATPYAFIAAVGAEVIASRDGFGHLIKTSASVVNPSGMFAAILTVSALAAASAALTNWLDRCWQWRL